MHMRRRSIRRYKKYYKTRRKKSLFKRKIFWGLFLLFVFLGTGSYFIFFSQVFQVKAIEISGNQKIDKENLRQVIDQEITQDFLFFNLKNIFFADQSEIKKTISNKFHYVADITLKKDFPNKIIAFVKERMAVALWCQEEICYLLDKEGVIFDRKEKDGLPVIDNERIISDISLGKIVIDKALLESALEINEGIRGSVADILIKKFVILAEKEQLTIVANEGWEIYCNPEKNIQDQIFNLETVIKKEIPQTKRNNLFYIDLRFGSRVYFKYK